MQSEKMQKKAAKLLINSGRYAAETLERIAVECDGRGDTIEAAILRQSFGRKPAPQAITVYGSVVRTTEKAILFAATYGDWVGEAWFQKSQYEAIPNQMHGLSSLCAPAAVIREKFAPNTKG
jgi:hypothetical protein